MNIAFWIFMVFVEAQNFREYFSWHMKTSWLTQASHYHDHEKLVITKGHIFMAYEKLVFTKGQIFKAHEKFVIP